MHYRACIIVHAKDRPHVADPAAKKSEKKIVAAPPKRPAQMAAFLAAIGARGAAQSRQARHDAAAIGASLGNLRALSGADRKRRRQSVGQRAARHRAGARSSAPPALLPETQRAPGGARRHPRSAGAGAGRRTAGARQRHRGARRARGQRRPRAGASRWSACAAPANRRSAACWRSISAGRSSSSTALVEEDYGASIPDLIEMAGTATFRRHERSALERVIAEHEAAIITTAGGIVADPETYALLLRRTHTVWIKARPEDHMSRVMAQGDFRPMAQNRERDGRSGRDPRCAPRRLCARRGRGRHLGRCGRAELRQAFAALVRIAVARCDKDAKP